jgi:hypothetical protein
MRQGHIRTTEKSRGSYEPRLKTYYYFFFFAAFLTFFTAFFTAFLTFFFAAILLHLLPFDTQLHDSLAFTEDSHQKRRAGAPQNPGSH